MNSEHQPNRELVTLSDLLFEGGGGSFNHLIWHVQPTLNIDSVSDALASIHEWSHHELNNVSSCGLLLSYFAFLARHADDKREHFAEQLNQLVANCKVAHEVYATWYSVELLRTRFEFDELKSHLPSDYQTFFSLGERVVHGISSPFLRQQVFVVVMRSCFESQPFAEFDCSQSADFRLNQVRHRDLPNSRLDFVTNTNTEELFSNWVAEYCNETEVRRNADAIAVAITKGRDEHFFDLPLPEADAVLRDFLQAMILKWNDWLLQHGILNGEFEAHLRLVHSLVENMNQRCSEATVPHPLEATTSPHDTAAVLLQQMESEVVRIRRDPIRLSVLPIAELPREVWEKLPVGQPPHLFVQVRSADEIRQQHRIDDEKSNDVFLTGPVVCLRRREPNQQPGSDETANLFVFRDAAQLRELREVTSEIPAYGLLSSSVSVDQSWMDEWLDESILWATKIDHSLFAFLTQHCERSEQVRYSTSTICDGSQVLNFMCFLTRKENEQHWGLYIGFCSDHTAKACVQFIEQKLDPSKIVFDPEPFQGDLAPVLQVIATHMLRDECFFSFNQLIYS